MLRVAGVLPTALSLAVLACPAGAQIGAGLSAEAGPVPPPHRFQPYTAEFRITHVQSLADGTTITSEGTEIRARDSAGITMQSNTNESWELGRVLGTSGGVHDTDGTILANWYSVTKDGHIFKMPPKEQRHGCWTSGSVRMAWDQAQRPAPPQLVFNPVTRTAEQVPSPVQRSRPNIHELGSILIQGVEAHGQRITRTIAAGEVGNDQTIIRTEENWMAPSLGLELRQSIEDPRTGKRTRELVNLTLEEPDPSLFQPPADYNATTEEMHQVACKQ